MISDVAAEVMVERTSSTLCAYFQAKSLTEQQSSRKIHTEELTFVLAELLKLDLFAGALKAKNMKGGFFSSPAKKEVVSC